MAKPPIHLFKRYGVYTPDLYADTRLNAAAVRLWLYMADMGYQNKPPDMDYMQHIAGRRPYSKAGVATWKDASVRHLRDLLTELEQAGFIDWNRKDPMHERFVVFYLPDNWDGGHGHADDGHGHADDGHGHADDGHGHAHLSSLKDSKNQDQNNKGGGSPFEIYDKGEELIRLGFFRGVAAEFQSLPEHQFRAIVKKAKQAGPDHIGAVVEWARARIREGWPEQERSNNHAENQPGRRTGGERRGREPQIDLEDLPEWLRNGG